jgi:hypothetical protein
MSVVVSGQLLFKDSGGHYGPFRRANGVVVAVTRDWGTARVHTFNSTTWTSNAASHSFADDIYALWAHLDTANDVLWIAAHISGSALVLISYTFATDTWSSEETIQSRSGNGGGFGVQIAPRPSDGRLFLMFQADVENVSGADRKRVQLAERTGAGSYTLTDVDDGGATSYETGALVWDGNGVLHLFYNDGSGVNIVYKRLEGGVLSSVTTIGNTGGAFAVKPIFGATAIVTGGVQRVTVGWRGASGTPYFSQIDDGSTPSSPAQISATALHVWDSDNTPAAALVADGTTQIALFADATDHDLYSASKPVASTFAAASEIQDAIDAQAVDVAVWQVGYDVVLAWMWLDATAGNVQYDSAVLRTIDPGVVQGKVRTVVRVDWDRDGDFDTAGDDITGYVMELSCPHQGLYAASQGMAPQNVAAVGMLTITLNNWDKRFSPRNAGGPLYGKLKPARPVTVQLTDGVTTVDAFTGILTRIVPEAGENGPRRCVLAVGDQMEQLQGHQLSLPLQEDKRGDELVRQVAAAAFNGDPATGWITFAGQPSDGDTVTVGDRVYTYKNTLAAADQVKIGAALLDSINNLAAAINAAPGEGTTYGTNTVRHEEAAADAPQEIITQTNTDGAAVTLGNLGGTSYRQAQSFTLTQAGRLTKITFDLAQSVGSPTGTLTWEIRANSSGAPGTLLLSGTMTPTASATNTINVASAVDLAAGIYWLVLYPTSAQASGNYWWWRSSRSANFPSGWMVYSTTGGASWTNNYAEDAMFSITAVAGVEITALARGTLGNAIALAKSGTNLAVSGATLSGGTDGDVTLDLETGTLTHDVAADQWTEDMTNAMSAVQDVIQSEGTALLWAAEDGSIKYKDKDWLFKQAVATSVVTIAGQMNEMDAPVDIYSIHNEVVVTYTPRGTGTPGTVIARSNGTLEIPLTTRSARWVSTKDLPDGGKYVVRLPFADSVGEVIGAKAVIAPVEGTDFKYWESINGREYTGRGEVVPTAAVTATGVEITWLNLGGTPFYVTDLVVRGTPVISYDQQQAIRQDAASIAEYGKRSYTHDLPLYSSQEFAESLADYLLNSFADATQRITSMDMQGQQVVAGVFLFALKIGDVIGLTNAQLGIGAAKAVVIGRSWSWRPGGATSLRLDLRQLDDVNYLILDDPVYGLLDGSNRWAFM